MRGICFTFEDVVSNEAFLTGALGDGEVAELQLIGGLDEPHAEGAEIEQDFFDIDVVETLFGYLRTERDRSYFHSLSSHLFSEEQGVRENDSTTEVQNRQHIPLKR